MNGAWNGIRELALQGGESRLESQALDSGNSGDARFDETHEVGFKFVTVVRGQQLIGKGFHER